MKRLRQTAFIAASLACCGGVSCRGPGASAAYDPDAGPLRLGSENTVVVQRETLETGPRLSGSLEPREQARVRAEVGGQVTSVEVDLGAQVEEGQVLARIEDVVLRNGYASAVAAVRAAQVEMENARRQTARTQRLVEGGALAQRELESVEGLESVAHSRLSQARAQLAQAQQQLRGATVRAPFSGVVSEKAVSEGDVVAPGLPLFTVIDPSTMRLQASVPSEALPTLEPGAKVRFEVRGYPGQAFEGTLEQIAPAADPVTRQITTLVSIPNPGGALLAGLFAEGRVTAEARQALVVPEVAVERGERTASVLRVEDGRVERVPVDVGLSDPLTERVEVEGALQPGDVLVNVSTLEVEPGTPVELDAAPQAKE